MTNTEQYEGWTNRETWAANLWLANDEGLYRSVCDLADEALEEGTEDVGVFDAPEKSAAYLLEATLKDFYEELVGTLDEAPNASLLNMVTDIGSVWRINWAEIAGNWIIDAVERKALA